MPGSATVNIGENQWAVDVAASPDELTTGLAGLESIPAGTGMLFDLGSEQTVEVTTEPMLFNIDIIFISEGLEVVDVVRDVAPGFLVTEETPVRYFLEVNAGETEGIEAGDSVEIADYEYTPPSAISQWMPMIIGLSVLGFIGAMVGGMVTGGSSSSSSSSQRRLSKPKTEAERLEAHERKYGTKELPERGKGLEEHHSMWLTMEQRKECEKLYGAVACRWGEEYAAVGDFEAVKRAAKFFYKKMSEAVGIA